MASVIRRLDNVDYLAKTLVGGGAVVALFAIVEARTGFNVFNHLSRVIPILHATASSASRSSSEFGAAKLARLRRRRSIRSRSAPRCVMLTPLALYLARRYRQRRWMLCAALVGRAAPSTVSRTGIVMFVVVVARLPLAAAARDAPAVAAR